jgi:2-phosphosulfolactate phosphatase
MAATAGASAPAARRSEKVVGFGIARLSPTAQYAEPVNPAVNPHPSHRQHGYRRRMDWGRAGVQLLAREVDLVIVVDVLSFSTAVSVAVERGAAVIPYRVPDTSAADYARGIGATLAGADRSGPGPTLSPASLTALRGGERLVLPSPNGAGCASLAAEAGASVVAGCLRNASAVARFAALRGGPTAVIAAGELWPDGRLWPAVEDLIGAGAVLAGIDADAMSPEAKAAVAVFRAARDDLLEALAGSASGRELVDRGFSDDVAMAARLDVTDLVPMLRDGVFQGQ